MTWRLATIGDLLERTELRDPTRWPNAHFFYVDVSSVDNRTFSITQPTKLLGAEAPSRARKVIRTRDVIFATVRPTLRRIAIVGPTLDDQICSTGFCVLRAGPKLDPGFLYFWLLTDFVVEHVSKIEKGVSYPAIRDSDVKAICIPYPPLEEQQQIAFVLSAVQRAIELQERLIALTVELKRGLIRKLFTGGTRGEPQKQTEIGLVPASWTTATLRNLSELIVDCPHTTPKFVATGIRVVRNYNMRDGEFAPDPVYYTSEAEYEQRVRRAVPKAGDVLFSREAPVGEACVLPEGVRTSLGQRLMLIRTDPQKLDPDFLVASFYSPNVRTWMSAIASGITTPHLNVSDVRNLVLPVPSMSDQLLISACTRATHRRLASLREGALAYRNLFRTLLHQLMTAQIHACDLDLSALENPEREQIGAA